MSNTELATDLLGARVTVRARRTGVGTDYWYERFKGIVRGVTIQGSACSLLIEVTECIVSADFELAEDKRALVMVTTSWDTSVVVELSGG